MGGKKAKRFKESDEGEEVLQPFRFTWLDSVALGARSKDVIMGCPNTGEENNNARMLYWVTARNIGNLGGRQVQLKSPKN